jgi:hypothetical protein
MMNQPVNSPCARLCVVGIALWAASTLALGAAAFVSDTTVAMVAAHGGTDTSNPGTACIQFATTPAAACVGGWVALPNNNKQLIAAALMAKATGARVMLYYDDAVSTQHCPGLAFTPCAVISLVVK